MKHRANKTKTPDKSIGKPLENVHFVPRNYIVAYFLVKCKPRKENG